ncbi:YeeE/YedE family protein [Methylibium sp.]|uniref:YeeE/YedE family protein n=1 Tax=Methylibium sp. TaxID=2067992 RepID=UPI003D113292
MALPLSPYAAAQTVLWGGLMVGVALGAVAQATRFCTMGALADWFTYGGTARLMMWILAVAVAATCTLSLIGMEWLDATRTVAWSDRFLWLSYLAGGALFGYGMVLTSGCPQRSLVKAGAGSLKSWVTLIVAAIAAQMTLRGVLAEPRVRVLDAAGIQLAHPQDLGSMLSPLIGAPPAALRWAVLALVLASAVVLLWRARAGMERSHWIGGVLVGLLVPVAWALTGHLGFIPEHPDTLEAAWLGTYSHRPEALTFAAPIAHSLDLLTLWSDRNNAASFGVTVTLGVLLGSAASAVIRKEFHIESFRNAEDMGNHLLGGLLMGFGGVTAMGCSIGQGISGLSLLSAGSCLAVAGIVSGAWLALRVQTWRLDRNAA